jgi:hypothetical protein
MPETDEQQRYAPGYEPGFTDLFRFRSAERFARHLLPHLRPGLSVLDGGCGPGTITVGLASRVSPVRYSESTEMRSRLPQLRPTREKPALPMYDLRPETSSTSRIRRQAGMSCI